MTHNTTDSAKRWIRLLVPIDSILDPMNMDDLHRALPHDLKIIEWEKRGAGTLAIVAESIEFMAVYPGSPVPERTPEQLVKVASTFPTSDARHLMASASVTGAPLTV
jgi:hypothetical protein